MGVIESLLQKCYYREKVRWWVERVGTRLVTRAEGMMPLCSVAVIWKVPCTAQSGRMWPTVRAYFDLSFLQASRNPCIPPCIYISGSRTWSYCPRICTEVKWTLLAPRFILKWLSQLLRGTNPSSRPACFSSLTSSQFIRWRQRNS